MKPATQLENVSKSAKSRRWQGLGPKIWRMRSGWKPPMKQCIRPLIHLYSGVLGIAAIAPCIGLDAVSPRPVQSAEQIISRIVAWPGQYSTYDTGLVEILELREKAMLTVGDDFNIKEFHGIILEGGAIPLEMLREKVNWWLDKKKNQ